MGTNDARPLADLEAAILQDLATRGVKRESIRKAERLFDEMLRLGLKVRSLGELDDETIVDRFERFLAERRFKPGEPATSERHCTRRERLGWTTGIWISSRPVRDTSHPKWIEEHGARTSDRRSRPPRDRFYAAGFTNRGSHS